jgi:hypothetical protein
MGQTIDISEWLDFDFYDRVWYWDEKKTDMNQEQKKIRNYYFMSYLFIPLG